MRSTPRKGHRSAAAVLRSTILAPAAGGRESVAFPLFQAPAGNAPQFVGWEIEGFIYPFDYQYLYRVLIRWMSMACARPPRSRRIGPGRKSDRRGALESRGRRRGRIPAGDEMK
jgi:hypothetical protein